MSCTCCVCTWLPITRGFRDHPTTDTRFATVDLTSTKLVTWTDSTSGNAVVDGTGPLELQGQAGWVETGSSFLRVFSGSSVTFAQLTAPGVAIGTITLLQTVQLDDKSDVTPLSGSVSVTHYGQLATLRYALTQSNLPESINNAVYVHKDAPTAVPFESSDTITLQLPSQSWIAGPLGSTAVHSVLHTDTAISEFTERQLDGLSQLLSWREVISTAGGNWNVTDAQQPPALTVTGYHCAQTIEFAGQSLLLLTPAAKPVADTPTPIALELLCSGTDVDDERPQSAVWTATAFRPLDGAGGVQTNDQIVLTPTGPTGVSLPYCNGNLFSIAGAATGTQFSIARDGQQVLPPTQLPTGPQLVAATENDGSYLVTITATGSALRFPVLKDFTSFVIDKKRPVIGMNVLDDIFDGQTAPTSNGVLMSTKPLAGPPLGDDESDTGVLARVKRVPYWHNGTEVILRKTPGTYTLSPTEDNNYVDRANNRPLINPSQQWTVHALHPNYFPESQPGGHSYFGAIPKLDSVGLQTREYFRARLQSEKITSVRLTFDRPVDPDTVSSAQVRLLKNGQPVSGCTIQQNGQDTRHWIISVPTAAQDSASFFVLEYDPSGQVMTADQFPELHFATRDDFPDAVARGAELFRHVLVDDEFDVRYSIRFSNGTFEYIAIAGNPLDFNGNAYDPEPSVIVARTSWLMADTDGWPRLIDTTSVVNTTSTIGRAASITATLPLDWDEANAAISCDGDVAILESAAPGYYSSPWGSRPLATPQNFFEDIGIVASAVSREGYIPRMPVDDATGPYSYWGLGTTIDPSPPALVSPCAVPSERQWHSSAIVSGSEITGLQIRFVRLDEYGNEIEPPADGEGYINNKLLFDRFRGDPWSLIEPEGDFYTVAGKFDDSAGDFLFRAMCSAGTQLTLGQTFQGYTLAQNVWACVQDNVGDAIEACPASAIQINANAGAFTTLPPGFVAAYFINEDNTVTQSRVWLQNNPHFYVGTTTPEQTSVGAATVEAARAQLRLGSLNDLTGGSIDAPPTIRSVTSAVYTVERVQAMASAVRHAKTFLGMKTSTLGPLLINLSMRAFIKAETTYSDRLVDGEFGNAGVGLNRNNQSVAGGTFEAVNDAFVFALMPAGDQWTRMAADWVVLRQLGTTVAERTITERLLRDYVYGYYLTRDQERDLADGAELTLDLPDRPYPYKLKLKRI